jgi:hypothetical protein
MKIIAFTGKAKAGKTTAVNILKNKQYIELNFADPIYKIYKAIYGISKKQVQECKESPFTHYAQINWKNSIEEQIKLLPVGFKKKQNYLLKLTTLILQKEGESFSSREFLQEIGTDFTKPILGSDIWVKTLKNNIKDLSPHFNICIGDLRFDNEAKMLQNLNAHIVEIMRDVEAVNNHESENGINDFFIDEVIDNNGSIEDFEKSINMLIA